MLGGWPNLLTYQAVSNYCTVGGTDGQEYKACANRCVDGPPDNHFVSKDIWIGWPHLLTYRRVA